MQIIAEICQNRPAGKTIFFEDLLLLKSKSVELNKVIQKPGAEEQKFTPQKDVQRFYTNFYGEAQRSVSGQQLSQSLLLSH